MFAVGELGYLKILHLLSQNHLTGAEVYAATLARVQKSSGNTVHQISNGFFYPTEALKISLSVETKSQIKFIKNIFWLRSYIRKNGIEIVHAHSRASAKLAFWSTCGSQVAYVSTVHGKQHLSWSKKLFNQYGQFLIAVCENISDHLLKDFKYRENLLRVVRNPIDFVLFNFRPQSKKNLLSNQPLRIGIIGRTTGPKKERTEQLLHALFEAATTLNAKFTIDLVGGNKKDLAFSKTELEAINEIQIASLSSENYAKYDVIMGSGRVCIEALLTGVPCIAFGEAHYVGLIRHAHFNLALRSNFGDIDLQNEIGPQLNQKKFYEDLSTISKGELGNEELQILADKARVEFSADSVAQQLLRLYQSALFLKKYPYSIPVLMYHKIPDQKIQSRHKIYVLKKDFEKHLQFFKQNGFQTLTFSEIEKFRKGETHFSQFPKKPLVLTFDDGYRDNLENASPLLKKYGFRAQIFLLANQNIIHNNWDATGTEPSHEIVGGKDRLRWLDSAFEIGSHGFSHDKITSMTTDQAFQELKDSKHSLELEFSRPVNVFAYTYGDTNKKSAGLAASAGYEYAVNTDRGGLRLEEAPFEIFRVNIFPNETNWSLWKKTSRWYRRYYYWKRKK